MAKVTSKLQVTIPKAIADRYSIVPGDELEWIPGVDAVRVVPAKVMRSVASTETRLRLFDASTKRQRAREGAAPRAPSSDRGWTRTELYERGRPR